MNNARKFIHETINGPSDQKGLVLLSGGLDSLVTTAFAINIGFEVTALAFDYGQRHRRELASARAIAKHFDIPLTILELPALAQIGKSALTDKTIAIPKNRDDKFSVSEVYVPMRNLLMLTTAAAFCEARGNMFTIFHGANAADFAGFPDCREEFFKSAELAISLGTKYAEACYEIEVPLQKLSKASIISLGQLLDVPFELAWTCYDPKDVRPCNECDACVERTEGFDANGLADPLR